MTSNQGIEDMVQANKGLLTPKQINDNIVTKCNNVINKGGILSYSSEQTRERILSCARQDFLENGYERANLRRISENAKVTTGSLYAHFKSKEGLFDALVALPAKEFLSRYEEMHFQAGVSSDGMISAQTMKVSSECMDWMLEYIYEHFDTFKLIICCSEGTSYSGYIDRLIEIEEATTKRMMPVDVLKANGDFFIHVVCSSGIREFFEVVMHDLSKEEAIRYIKKITQFHYGGWHAVLGSTDLGIP